VDVYLLWHIRHARNLDGSPTVHRDESGDLVINEEDGDDVKLIGVYSTVELAMAAIDRSRGLEGFRDEPDCFIADPYTLDQDHWTDGFISVPHDES